MSKVFGFIGAGHLGSSIIEGYAKFTKKKDFFVYDTVSYKKTFVEKLDGIFAKSAKEVALNCDYISLIVRPNQVSEVLFEIKDSLNDNKIILSFCAGITADFIRQKCELPNLKVVRVMPNTAATTGLSATAYSFDEKFSEEETSLIEELLSAIGTAYEIPPDKMNEIIPINASAPGFIAFFAKCFLEYAKEVGVDEKTASLIFADTLYGTGSMLSNLNNTGKSIDDFIAMIATPGGTTAAGLFIFEQSNFSEIIKKACKTCAVRANEISKEVKL